jgi:hypothetical protein
MSPFFPKTPFVIVIVVVLILFVIPSVYGLQYENQKYLFSIQVPEGWTIEEWEKSGNIVRFVSPSKNSFIYVALNNYPVIPSLTDNQYLDSMEKKYENLCQSPICSYFNIQDRKAISIDRNKAYLLTYSFLHSTGSSSAQVISQRAEIPDSGKTWIISNEYNQRFANENISIETIARSFQIESTTKNSKNIPNILEKLPESIPKTQPNNPETVNQDTSIPPFIFLVIIIGVVLYFIVKRTKGCKHSWKITYLDKNNSLVCIKCGKKSTGVR